MDVFVSSLGLVHLANAHIIYRLAYILNVLKWMASYTAISILVSLMSNYKMEWKDIYILDSVDVVHVYI